MNGDAGWERPVFLALVLALGLGLAVHFCGGLWDTAPSIGGGW